ASLVEEASESIGVLALIAGQDVEPGAAPGSWRIAAKVAKDRVISTVDTEAGHGHKSTAVRTDGFKAHLATEPDTGIITAVAVTPANVPDGPTGGGTHGVRVRRPRGPCRLRLRIGDDAERARRAPPPPRHQ